MLQLILSILTAVQAPSVEVAVSTDRPTLPTWGLLQATVQVKNRGRDPVPFDAALLGRTYAGARLLVEVMELQSGGLATFVSDPEPDTVCGKEVALALESAEEGSLLVTVGGKIVSIPRAGQPGPEFVPAFPNAGMYSVRVRYSYKGQEHVSNEIRISVTEPDGWKATLPSLKRLGERAFWLYEPQVIPVQSGREHLTDMAFLANGAMSAYSDYASLALATYFSRLVCEDDYLVLSGLSKEFALREAKHYLEAVRGSHNVIADSLVNVNAALALIERPDAQPR